MLHGNKQEQLALILTRKLLEELADPKRHPGVPTSARERAAGLVKHFPSVAKIDLLYQSLRKDG
jgi:hypothetical protein